MKIFELIKDSFLHYSKEFFKWRKEQGFMANLFFIPLVFAIVLGLAILVKLYVPEGWL